MAKKLKLQPTGADRSELRRLLVAAKQYHWDDGPRLAIADWLEEHGDEADQARADCLRLQLDTDTGGPNWWWRVQMLEQRCLSGWLGRGKEVFGRARPYCRRGLLACDLGARRWLGRDDTAVAASPEWEWVESASFKQVGATQLGRLLDSRLLSTVPRLGLGHQPNARKALPLLASSAGFARLRSLDLAVGREGTGILGAVLGEADAGGLRELVLAAASDGDWVPLGSAESLSGLRRLVLRVEGLAEGDARRLAASPLARGLHDLDIDPGLGAALPFRALADSGGLASLRRLRIGSADQREAWAAFASAPFAGTLEELRLHHGALTGASPFRPPRLRRLYLFGIRLQDSLPDMAKAGIFRGLSELGLSYASIDSPLLRLLLDAADGPRNLDLSFNPLGDKGAVLLAAWPGLAAVRHLHVSSCGIGDAGLGALAASRHLAALEALNLYGNRFGPRGVAALLRSPAAARLRWLSLVGLHGRNAEAAAKAILGRPPPALRVLLGLKNTSLAPRLRAALPDCAID